VRAAFIVSAARLPTGKFLGGLKEFPATQLGALAVRAAVARAGLDPGAVDECIMGNVLAAGLGQNPARQAALHGGLSDEVAALTINKVCGSGLKAVMLAAQGIAAGDIDVAVAGGMESMSNAPYLLPRVREGLRMGDGTVVDVLIRDGLWCAFEQWHMGNAGELVAENYRVSREAQDAFAAASHQKAAQAAAAGRFRSEIVPVEIPQRKVAPLVPLSIDQDETIRPDSTVETLRVLKPAFKAGGTVTAGNAPGVNDGAAALVVMAADRMRGLGIAPLARIAGQATSGLAPKLLLMTPVESIRKLLKKVGWKIEDVDLFEINEAFAAQMVAILNELRLDPARVNVNGGAIALGHPIGASGARILTTLVHEMQRRGAKRGVASLCLGGGNGVALAVET
jgi:acetyl-CoA C-acetyltransferase